MTWELAVLISGATLVCTGFFLAVYLDLLLHALKQSGDLPPETRLLFAAGWWGGNGGIAIDTEILYSREFREINNDTRRLTPIIRVALPVGFVVAALGMVLLARGQAGD